MEFEWDPKKAVINLYKHKVSFDQATEVFDDPHGIEEPNHFESEERWQITGMTTEHLLLFVVYAFRKDENGMELTRIISARHATPKERRHYEHG